jgi:dTDP-4-amino-4,6-dideoxygalactose transaminase
MSESLPTFVPLLGPEVHEAVSKALEIGYLGLGPTTAEFEGQLARWIGTSHHVSATNSCTHALHLAAVLAGAGPGTEIICPSFTYVAAQQAMTMTGAAVVFVDIDPVTLSVDPARVRELVTDRTVAIMTMHYAGHVGDVAGIYAIAAEHGLRVIEDAAHAIGSLLPDGRMVGTAGDLVCFSFGPVKTLTTLEGGALLVASAEEDVVTREHRMLGADLDLDARKTHTRFWDYDVVRQGYRYHLGTVPAAVGLAQLQTLDAQIARRRSYCKEYDARLADVPEVHLLGFDWDRIGPFIHAVRVDADSRDALVLHLKEIGIGANVHWGMGVHTFSHYAGARRGDLSVTEQVCKEVVTLPLWAQMPEQARDRVVSAIRGFYGA